MGMGRAPVSNSSAEKKLPTKINLEPFGTAVNEAAARVRGLWLGYIALLAYLFIAVGAVTHRDLLLENPVKLPVLNVELPLIGFFTVAPIFFLINHFFLLLQLKELGRRIREFNDEIDTTKLSDKARQRQRRTLDTFVIVQLLGVAKAEHEQLTSKLLNAIALITLVIAPTILLLTFQLQFLPYQNELVTWMHRIALGIDLALLWIFWPSINNGEWSPMWCTWVPLIDNRSSWWRKWVSLRGTVVSIVVIFACAIATFPGEFMDGGIEYADEEDTIVKDWRNPSDSNFSWLKGQLFGELSTGWLSSDINERVNKRERLIPFYRGIDLADDKTLIDLDKFDKIIKRNRDNKDNLELWNTTRTLSLRNRSLRGAMLDRTDLRNVDFFQARLQGASLNGADLQGASLDKAYLQGASFDGAKLQGASIKGVELQGVSLDYANLRGAELFGAKLQGASFNGANLQGASFNDAKLQGASFNGAKLQGASFNDAKLQGASLNSAYLQGASLNNAKLHGASLHNTFLWRAYATTDRENLTGIWVKAPILSKLSPEQLAKLETEALLDVESEDVKNRIKKRLARLSVSEKHLKNLLPKNFWSDLEGKVSEADHRKNLAKRLVILACAAYGAPYVAQGLFVEDQLFFLAIEEIPDNEMPPALENGHLMSSRLEDIGPDHLPRVARKLLNSAEGTTTDCPGVKELNAASIAQLRKWVVTPKNKTKKMAK